MWRLPMFTPFWRKFFLTLHVATSVGLAGAVGGFLALAIVGAATPEVELARTSYVAMATLTWTVIVPLAAASLVLGLVQSLGTPWGLARYYWIVVKLVLTIIAVAVLLLQLRTIDALAQAALTGNLGALTGSRFGMIGHAAGGLVVIVVAIILSVFKPRGMTRYGARGIGTD